MEAKNTLKKSKKLKQLVENLVNDRFALGEIAEGIRNHAKDLEDNEDFDGAAFGIWRLYGFAQLIDVVEQDLMHIGDRLSRINDLRA